MQSATPCASGWTGIIHKHSTPKTAQSAAKQTRPPGVAAPGGSLLFSWNSHDRLLPLLYITDTEENQVLISFVFLKFSTSVRSGNLLLRVPLSVLSYPASHHLSQFVQLPEMKSGPSPFACPVSSVIINRQAVEGTASIETVILPTPSFILIFSLYWPSKTYSF